MSQNSSPKPDLSIWRNLKYDAPAGLVVFLVAIPLCLGIALASKGEIVQAPLFSGILAGIIGGLVIPFISRSPLSVSGPAAGLIAIVITGMDGAGSFEAFLVAVFLGGLFQIGLGLLKAGTVAYFFPSAVIKGMLAAIGLILIRKQLPHAFGVDSEAVDLNFHILDTIPVLREIVVEGHFETGAILISIVGLAILLLWERPFFKKLFWLPGALVTVILGVVINQLYHGVSPDLALLGGAGGHLVSLPDAVVNDGISGFFSELRFPDFSVLSDPNIYLAGITIGLVASVESLLSVEAVDKLDPHKRSSPLNRELLAQGVGNTIAGLIGALPVTTVIVRSSANVNSGGRTRMSAIIHGALLLVATITLASVLNMIPLASLAVILLLVGYKLARPSLWRQMYARGMNQFLPFVITIVAVLVTDLLKGIAIGTLVGIFFTIRSNFKTAISSKETNGEYLIDFKKDVSFLNKAIISQTLNKVQPGEKVIIDGTKAQFIDRDIKEIIQEFSIHAAESGIELILKGVNMTDTPLAQDLSEAEKANTGAH